MFDAHINVECCQSVKSIKYVCKYVNKGFDMAAFEIRDNTTDEIANYQTGRYVPMSEAMWRIYSCPLHKPNSLLSNCKFIGKMDSGSISFMTHHKQHWSAHDTQH